MHKSNKDFVQHAHAILKAQGHDLPLGHLYEMFAKVGGFVDWNTAKAKGAEFSVGGPDALGLDEGERFVVINCLNQYEGHDEKMRKRKYVRVIAEAQALVNLDATYVMPEGFEWQEDTYEHIRAQFIDTLNEWELMAPKDREHIDVEVVSIDEDSISPDSENFEVEDGSEKVDRELEVGGPVQMPSIEAYGLIAKGLRMQREWKRRGIILPKR